MSLLHPEWEPGFGTVFTWFGIDAVGRIAMFVNNCFGNLPQELLKVDGVDSLLDRVSEIVWNESNDFKGWLLEKDGDGHLDVYSRLTYRDKTSRTEVELALMQAYKSAGRFAELSVAKHCGLYLYHALEGDVPIKDSPVGYDGSSRLGDYFRYIVPTVFARIEDFPPPLRSIFCVSDTLRFEQLRLMENTEINTHFTRMYR